MNYQKIYNDLIENAKLKNRVKINKSSPNYVYYENHHIIPKCMNGTNDQYNLVLLTAREHFLAHKILTFIYPINRKLACALHRMTFGKKLNGYVFSSRDYDYARNLYNSIPVSIETKTKMSKNNIVSNEMKQYLKEINTGNKNPMFGKKVYDMWLQKFGKEIADLKQKQWKEHKKGDHIPWNKNKKNCFSKETIIRISESSSGENNGMYGKKHKIESIQKMKNRVFSDETKKLMSKNHPNVSGDKNPNYGYRKIKKGNQIKKIKKEDLNFWINKGWTWGRKNKGV